MEKHLIEIQKNIFPILKSYKIKKAGIFGSYARGDFGKTSDIDILVDVPKEYSLLDLIRIKLALEKVLKKSVDLVEYENIKEKIKQNILNEEVRIYG